MNEFIDIFNNFALNLSTFVNSWGYVLHKT